MDRRRLMYEDAGDPSLIFYAPLTQNDFTDHISGVSLNAGPIPSRMSWDSTKQKYKVTKRGGSGTENLCWSGIDLTSITNAYTIVCDAQAETYSRYNYPNIVTIYTFNNGTIWLPGVIGMDWESSSDKVTLRRRAIIVNGSSFGQYTAGYGIVANTNPSSNAFPQNWSSSWFTLLSLQDRRSSNEPNISCWVNNIRIYNRALTQSEIEAIPDL